MTCTRIIALLLLPSGCLYRSDDVPNKAPWFDAAFVRWQAKLANGADAGSGCVLTNNTDSWGRQLVVSAEPGDTIELTETFHRFRTTSDAWSAHSNDDEYWCAKSGAERWGSVRNPFCFEPFDPDQAPPSCSHSDISLVDREILPPGDYPDTRYVQNADGFQLTLQLGSRGEQCLKDCDRGQLIEFVVE
jgi:hypothetical protein